jgi:hypothetical protein
VRPIGDWKQVYDRVHCHAVGLSSRSADRSAVKGEGGRGLGAVTMKSLWEHLTANLLKYTAAGRRTAKQRTRDADVSIRGRKLLIVESAA